MASNRLPSPKQRALLEYIDAFIKENNYAPSYREVMRALDYKSVSTVASHINGLIERGWLVKRDNEKRSVEVVYKAGQSETRNSPAPSLASASGPVQKEKASEQELLGRIEAARAQVEVGATYVHYKGGVYKVTGLAIQTEDDEVCVLYEAQYGDRLTFTRALNDWTRIVDATDGSVTRFRKRDV